MNHRKSGVVRWFDGSKGYGYIETEDGQQIFVHHSALRGPAAPFLLKGQQVSFFVEDTVRGPQALEVSRQR